MTQAPGVPQVPPKPKKSSEGAAMESAEQWWDNFPNLETWKGLREDTIAAIKSFCCTFAKGYAAHLTAELRKERERIHRCLVITENEKDEAERELQEARAEIEKLKDVLQAVNADLEDQDDGNVKAQTEHNVRSILGGYDAGKRNPQVAD